MNRTATKVILGLATITIAGPAETARADGPPVSVVGTWGARLPTPGGADRLCFYTFRTDGAIQENDYTPSGHPLGAGRGAFRVAGDGIAIAWSPASIEGPAVRLLGPDAMSDRIVSHTGNPAQVGTSIVFRRITPRLIEAARRQSFAGPANPPSVNGGFPWSYDLQQ